MPSRSLLAATAAGALLIAGLPAATQAATVDTPPTREITGGATGLDSAYDVAVDGAGNRYVSNYLGSSITVYAPTATGNAAPIRTISGAATGLGNPTGVALDSSGNLYVANNGPDTVTVYAPGATGNAAPLRTVAGATTLLSNPGLLRITGSSIVVANSSNNTVAFFPLSASGDVAPSRTIVGAATGLSNPWAVAVDSGGRLYVGSLGVVNVYADGASGNVAPVRTLTGAVDGFNDVSGLALDAADNLYVSSEDPPNIALLVFPPQATTGTAPTTVLSGPASKVTGPNGLVVLGDGSVVLANQSRLSPFSNDSVTTYAPLVGGGGPGGPGGPTGPGGPGDPAATAPGKVRKLKVAGEKDDAKRKVTWKAPSSDGGAPVTGYKVVVKKGSTVVKTKTLKALVLQLKRSKLPAGTLKVTVVAMNSTGLGAGVTTTFKVVK